MSVDLKGETFDHIKVSADERRLGPATLERCTFLACTFRQGAAVDSGLVVSGVKATRCELDTCIAIGVRFEDVEIDTLAVKGSDVALHGCVFSRVTLKGKIGALVVGGPVDDGSGLGALPDVSGQFRAVYEQIDWALDISEAGFTSVDLSFVPGDLVRRDPETQFLVRRSSFHGVDPAQLPNLGRVLRRRFTKVPFDSMVVAAPTRSRQFQDQLDELRELRDLGLAE